MIDLTGQKFGKLTIIRYHKKQGTNSCWICKCDCGNEKSVNSVNLKSGSTISCGCHIRSVTSKRVFKHGLVNTTEYFSYRSMINRCTNPNSDAFFDYGMKGIIVCERWLHSFENFIADMGMKPTKNHSIDRYPNKNGNYEPSNCRWATRKQQNGNRRNNRVIEFDGKKMILQDLANELKVNRVTLSNYLKIHSIKDTINHFKTKTLCH